MCQGVQLSRSRCRRLEGRRAPVPLLLQGVQFPVNLCRRLGREGCTCSVVPGSSIPSPSWQGRRVTIPLLCQGFQHPVHGGKLGGGDGVSSSLSLSFHPREGGVVPSLVEPGKPTARPMLARAGRGGGGTPSLATEGVQLPVHGGGLVCCLFRQGVQFPISMWRRLGGEGAPVLLLCPGVQLPVQPAQDSGRGEGGTRSVVVPGSSTPGSCVGWQGKGAPSLSSTPPPPGLVQEAWERGAWSVLPLVLCFC